MSSLSRRPSHVEPSRNTTFPLAHWLLGALVAGLFLTSSLSASPAQHRPISAGRTGFTSFRVAKISRPYLAITGPAPLRFASPLPDFSPELALATPTEGSEEENGAELTTEPVAPAVQAQSTSPETAPAEPPPASPSGPSATAQPAPSGPPPVSILPDDLARQVKPEDFLPFFLPPLLPSAPPSQATYQQK